jgi:hypothetical protein
MAYSGALGGIRELLQMDEPPKDPKIARAGGFHHFLQKNKLRAGVLVYLGHRGTAM